MPDTRLAILESGFGLGGWIPRALDITAKSSNFFASSTSFGKSAAEAVDRKWMTKALIEAMDGIGRTSPNPSVGAVLVKEGKFLSAGSTQIYGSLHAERVALLAADKNELRGSTCYVTLEPCGGTGGKQPPCADALIAAGVARVVIAAQDPHIKAASLGIEKLKAAGVKVETGCMKDEAQAWHFPFLAYQDKKSPIVIGKWAQTLDGHLADDQDHSQWISGGRSRIYTHWLRQKYDAIMVGIGTVLHDKPRLTARDSALPIARHPHKIVFDPSMRLLGASAEVLDALFDSTSAAGTVVYWCTDSKSKSKHSSPNLPASLAPYRDRLIHLPTIDFANWSSLFDSLAADHLVRFGRELQSIMVEGGSQLLTLMMRADLLDACHVFVRAGFLGGSKNRIARLERGDNPSIALMQRRDYRLLGSQSIDDDVVMECVHRRYNFWD